MENALAPDFSLVEPGHPELSVLLALMLRRDSFGMPPLATSQVDAEAVQLVEQLISNLNCCWCSRLTWPTDLSLRLPLALALIDGSGPGSVATCTWPP